MPLDSPVDAYLQMAQMRNQNKRNMYQDMAGIGQGLGQGLQGIGDAIQEDKKRKIVQQLVQAMQTQGAPQQGPQMPTGPAIRGPQGYVPPGAGPSAVPAGQMPMPQNPTSGMGGPAADNTQQIKALLMQADPKGAMGAMEGQMFPPAPTPMNPLQQSQMGLNQAKIAALQKGPQAKPMDPLDAMIKQKKLELMALMVKKMGVAAQPKPPNPVPAEALDLRAQIANNQQAPWYKKLGFGGGLKPVKVNASINQSSPSQSGPTDEELYRMAAEDDNQ